MLNFSESKLEERTDMKFPDVEYLQEHKTRIIELGDAIDSSEFNIISWAWPTYEVAILLKEDNDIIILRRIVFAISSKRAFRKAKRELIFSLLEEELKPLESYLPVRETTSNRNMSLTRLRNL